jgi:uncharacterized protein
LFYRLLQHMTAHQQSRKEEKAQVVNEEPVVRGPHRFVERRWGLLLAIAFLAVVGFSFLFFKQTIVTTGQTWVELYGTEFLIFLAGGFVAQMIDGALGMAYGVSATTFLMSFGVSPAAASASVHTSEIFSSGASGLAHLRFQNVNKKLFRTLVVPGAIGAALGAYILSSFEEYNYLIRPVVAAYTLALGIIIIRKAFVKRTVKRKTKNVGPLAGFGGFMDSIGGGGWGPIVASTLIAKGRHPRYTIGSVNLAEFFVSLASSVTFFITLGSGEYVHVIVALVLGGVIAAPIAARLTQKLPIKKLMVVVGVVIILVSIRLIAKAFGII